MSIKALTRTGRTSGGRSQPETVLARLNVIDVMLADDERETNDEIARATATVERAHKNVRASAAKIDRLRDRTRAKIAALRAA